MLSSVKIRPSTDADIPAIAAIYAYYVKSTTTSFELAAPALNEITRRRAVILEHEFPYLIAESGKGQLLGYAYTGPYRLRPAYRFTVEDSIYIDHAHTGRGIGHLFLSRLIEESIAAGKREMIAVIGGSDNLASIRLHERCGFTHAGLLKNVGYKFETWIDTVFMQRSLTSPI